MDDLEVLEQTGTGQTFTDQEPDYVLPICLFKIVTYDDRDSNEPTNNRFG